STSGTLTSTDVDNPDNTFMPDSISGANGDLTIDANGHWTFTANNAFNQLNVGDKIEETFTVSSIDGTPSTIKVTINGTNDKPVVSSWTQLTDGMEDKAVTIQSKDLLTHATDVDSGDILSVANLQANHGTIVDNLDGTYTFTPDKDYNGEVRLTYRVEDTHGGIVNTQAKFNLIASPDNAVITDAQTNADLRGVTEDRGYIDTHYQLHYDGKLNIQDPDSGEAQFDPNIGPQTYQGIGYDTKLGGHILLMRDGHYTYTLDNRNIQNLAEGEVKQDSVVIRSVDGTTHTIELTVHGTNDTPTINAQSHSVVEGGSLLNGQMVGHDIDTGATLTYSAPQIDGLVFHPDGSYSFDPNHTSYLSLASGATKTLTIPVTLIDEHHASSTQNLSITITGANNSATISGVSTGDVDEGHGSYGDRSPDYAHAGIGKLGQDALTADGKLDIVDPDTGESQFDPKGRAWNNSYHGQYGHLLLNTDGTWHYDVTVGSVDWVNNRKTTTGTTIDQLGEGQTLTDTITIQSKDGTTHDIVITIHGDNDRPYCSSEVQLNSGKEDVAQVLTLNQLLQNTVDVDTNDLGKLTVENLHANHGSIAINADGTFTFTPDKDYSGDVHFTYDVKDGHGGVTHTGATTSLASVNDNPDVSSVTDSVTEDTESHHSVDLLGSATDPEGDPLSISQIQVSFEGKTGPLPTGVSIAADGHTLIIDSHSQAFQHLSAGEKSDITLQYMVDDNHGGQSAATATVTVVGADDKAQLQSSTIDMTEGQALHTYNDLTFVKGNIGLVDPDTHDQTQFVHTSTQGTQGFGELDVWPDGHYSYSIDWARNHDAHNKVAALKQGETLTDQYQIQTSDGQTKLITVTIHGEDNNARIDVVMPKLLPTTQDIKEEHFVPASTTHLYAGGVLKVIDPDHDDAFLQPETISTAHHGEFKIQASGSWSYKIDNTIDEVQRLGEGESFTETHTVHSKDGTASQLLTVTVHGTNDAPIVSSQVQLAPSVEDTDIQLTTSELLSHTTDIDHNDIGHLSIANLVADHGQITDNKDGTYTFHPDKDYNGNVHFSYDVQDTHGGITHTGASTSLTAVDDKAIISGLDTGDIHESSRPNRSPDHAQPRMGEITNDLLYADGKLDITDPDAGESTFNTKGPGYNYHGQYGNLMLLDDGTWHYTLEIGQQASGVGRTIDKLGDGESLTDTITVYSKDGTSHDIVVTIHGDNDKPYCSSEVQLSSGKEDIAQVLTLNQLLQNTVDVDDNDFGKLSVENLHADNGSIAINADGSYTFTPTKDHNGPVHFNYDVKDAHGGVTHTRASLDLAAVADAAIITGQSNGDVDEGYGTFGDRSPDYAHAGIGKLGQDALTADGKLDIVDPDTGESQFDPKGRAWNNSYHGQYGHLLLNTDGTWHYDVTVGSVDWVNNRKTTTGTTIDQLGEGQTLTDTITIQSKDGTTHDIVITIHGDNDRPYCSSEVQLSSGKEDLAKTITSTELLANTVDVDANDLGKLTIANLQADHGSIRDNNDGTFTFTPDKDYNGDVHFTYDVKDAHGGVTQTGAVTTLSSVNDNATITAHSYGGGLGDSGHEDVYEDQVSGNSGPASLANALRVSGVLYVHDTDTGESVLKADTHTTQIGGVFEVVPSSGEWKYHIDNSNPAVQQLGENESIKETLTVNSMDGTGHYDVEVVIHGTNDAPVLIAQTQSVTENGAQLNGQMSATDIDSHDTLSYQIANAVDGLTFNADGSYSFDPANSAYQHLTNGHTQTLTIPVTVTDSSNASNTQNLVINITGSNDRPTVTNSHFGNSDEDKTHTFTATDFGFTDVDDGDTLHSVTISALPDPAKGHFSLNGVSIAMGQVVQASDIDKLAFEPSQDYNGGVQFGFMVNDGLRNSTPHIGRFTINPVRDGATITEFSTGSITEDGAHASTNQGITSEIATGKLDVVDPDPGESRFQFSQFGETAIHDPFNGHLRIDRSGSWQYTVDNAVLQHLAAGQTETVTYRIQSFDGTSYQLNIDVEGTNDAPVLSVTQTTSTTGILTESDVDVKDSHTFSVVNSTGQFGSISVDTDSGAYVYTANGSVAGMSYNSATHTYHGADVFEVKVADNHGGESSRFLTFDTNGKVNLIAGQQPTITTTVPQNPVVTTAQPSLPTSNNTPPSNTVTVDLAASSDNGKSDTDNLTNDNTPTITGHTDIPYSQVTIYDGSTPIGHAVSDASGQYSAVVSNLTDGDHNLSAKALAPSSVLPTTSSLLSVHVDTQIHIGIHTDPVTVDNVISDQESHSSVDITGSVSGDFNAGDVVTLNVNGTKHTGAVDSHGHYSIAVPGSELTADADQKIEASIAVTDRAGNSAHATTDVVYQVDTQVSLPTITFESAGADNLYSKAEIAHGHANTITATITPPSDAKIGEHLVVNGQDHVLDANTLAHGVQIEVRPGTQVQATMTDEHGNTAGSQGFAASAIPEPIVVKAPPGSHQVSGTLGVPQQLPSLTPVPTVQHGWRIHLPDGSYVTSHHGQYGTLTIDPQTGDLDYQEQANVHTGPHGSASGIGQHEDKFEIALQGTNQDEVVAHVNIQILSHGPGNSGKLNIGTEVVDMTITPITHTSHPAPPPPPPVLHDEPDIASQADFTVTQSDDSYLDLTQHAHQAPDQKASHHGAAAYLDALGIKPDATSTTVHDKPADMDIVLAQVDQQDAATHDQTHLDMSDALEHHDANVNHNQDDEHHHHNDVDGLPDIDPNP
ncbi:VCBS domain-containing protein, partial [Vibrio lentus]